jgi:hypothetical protein
MDTTALAVVGHNAHYTGRAGEIPTYWTRGSNNSFATGEIVLVPVQEKHAQCVTYIYGLVLAKVGCHLGHSNCEYQVQIDTDGSTKPFQANKIYKLDKQSYDQFQSDDEQPYAE